MHDDTKRMEAKTVAKRHRDMTAEERLEEAIKEQQALRPGMTRAMAILNLRKWGVDTNP